MKKENQDALKVVSQACAVYKGELQEHQAIQTALNVIKEALTVKGVPTIKPARKLKKVK